MYIPIVLAFTPNYVIPAATTIQSLLSSSLETDRYEIICLLSEPLSADMTEVLVEWNSTRLKFRFINLQDQLKELYVDARYTIAASYRLLLPDIVEDHEQVIYLDCDIIVRNNLAELFRKTMLHDYYLAAVFEATLDFQVPYVEKLGLAAGEYINSGFLLMNLQKMREDHIVPKLLEKANNSESSFPDQDAINIVCKGNIKGLNPIYNSIRTYFLPQYKADFLKYYTVQDWNAVQEHGTIHYTGSKPWNGYTIEFETWWKYYELMPSTIKKLGKVSDKLRVGAKLLRFWPVKIVFLSIQKIYRSLK